jgi:hypothetical protein
MWRVLETEEVHKGLMGKHEGKSPPGILGVDGRVILKRILKFVTEGVDCVGVTRMGQVEGTCERLNEPLSPIKCGKFMA